MSIKGVNYDHIGCRHSLDALPANPSIEPAPVRGRRGRTGAERAPSFFPGEGGGDPCLQGGLNAPDRGAPVEQWGLRTPPGFPRWGALHPGGKTPGRSAAPPRWSLDGSRRPPESDLRSPGREPKRGSLHCSHHLPSPGTPSAKTG